MSFICNSTLLKNSGEVSFSLEILGIFNEISNVWPKDLSSLFKIKNKILQNYAILKLFSPQCLFFPNVFLDGSELPNNETVNILLQTDHFK